jgi:ATP-dependent Zn protease
MKRLLSAVSLSSLPIIAFAQDSSAPPSRLTTAFLTWLPVIALVGLWWFFMRRLGGKRGYSAYVADSQERMASIDNSLKEISRSLQKLADRFEPPSSAPGA